MIKILYTFLVFDHCRIGSLETHGLELFGKGFDHCRIGSLEMINSRSRFCSTDHCRIGSLEKRIRFPDPSG